MFNIFFICFFIVLSNWVLFKNFSKLKLRKTFDQYLNSLQNININSNLDNHVLQKRLDMVSSNGFKLLFKILLLLIPYIGIFLFFRKIEFNYFFSLFLPIIGYLGILKNK